MGMGNGVGRVRTIRIGIMEAGVMNHSPIATARRLLVALLVGLLAVPPTWADDTEIYFQPAPPDAPPPLVMLTLDWRSNLTSTFCARKSDASCVAKFGTDDIGTQIYSQLDMAASAPVSLFDAFRAVFKVVFDSDVADGTRVGFMMSHNHDNGCTTGSVNCSNGGYVLRGFELFEAGDGNGAKDELLKIMKAIPLPQGAEAHPYQGLELFFEMYRYLAGLDVINGKLGYTDYESKNPGGTGSRNLDYEFSRGKSNAAGDECLFTLGANSGDNRSCADYIASGYTASDDSNLAKGGVRISSALTWDPGILKPPSASRYISPYNNDEDWSCSGAYSINMLFQVSQQDADSNTEIKKTLSNQGLGEWGLSSNPSLTFTNIISKLHQNDHAAGQATGVPTVAGQQNLTSYFLVDAAHANTTTNGYAAAGGTGNAIAALDDPRKLFEALNNIFNQINAVSSSYVAVTVPVNSDNRVTSLPHVFVALFQVDETGKPLWPGNVKKLDLVTETLDDGSKQLDVLDARGELAFNPITGRIDDRSLTLWTVPTAADVVAADTSKDEVSGRDGSSVRRGGAGHKIPGYRSGSVGLRNADTGARQIFLGPESFHPVALAGNAPVAVDASSDTGATRENADVQTRFGFRDVSAGCPEQDGTYCLSAIKEVLDAAAITYPGSPTAAQKVDMIRNATQALLKWVRGIDVFDSDADSSRTDMRPWLMGDVLHSRPLAINYGSRPPGGSGYSAENQDVRLVFGANDGLMRMVRNTLAGASAPSATTQRGDDYGEEVWAFMPRELLSHVPRLALTTSNVGLNRPYGADGEPTLMTIDNNDDGIIDNDSTCSVGADDCDRAWIYFGLRRGGKSYYALDISNPDAASPKLMWKIDDSMTDFTELGLTFSNPRVGWVRIEDVPGLNLFGDDDVNVPIPVVVVGGGYHGHAQLSGDHHHTGASKDTLTYTGGDAGEGNAVFLVHARTGELIWKATLGASTGGVSATLYQNTAMEHGIAAPVSPMDASGNGILDRLYVADTGGRVWRFDIPEFVPGTSSAEHREEEWKATVLADLRPADMADTPEDDLRFFHSATIVRRARDGIGVYDAIAVGSGDREHPQSEVDEVYKNNWFFLFKDRITTSGDPAVDDLDPIAPDDLLDVTDDCFTGSTGGACTAADLTHGWRLALEENGEKNLSAPFIGGNGIIFTTYLPEGTTDDDDPCVPLGSSRLYQVGLDKGEPLRFLHDVVGDTFSKTDRWINLYSGIDGGVVAASPDFWITATGKSGSNPPQKPIQFYWRESGIDTVN